MTKRGRIGRFDERGQAGVETIPFGILVFIGGVLLVVNVWSVVDARMTVDSAARDYLRAYTGAARASDARSAGATAAHETVAARGRGAEPLAITAPREVFGPCRSATVTVTLDVAAVRIPFLGTIGSTSVSATETELVAPFGAAIGPATDGTVCDA